VAEEARVAEASRMEQSLGGRMPEIPPRDAAIDHSDHLPK
jgi:hypothetical protein